jgi:hypothetical protein
MAEAPPIERRPRRRVIVRIAVVLAAFTVYAVSLLGYHLLASTSHPLGKPDLGTVNDTVVVIKIAAIHPVEKSIDVKVLVLPQDSLVDPQLDTLTTDIAVRLYPETDLEDLQYPRGKKPSQVATSLPVEGDITRWPFDTYRVASYPISDDEIADTISASVIVTTGDTRQIIPARVEVTGSPNGWDITTERSGEATQSAPDGDDVALTIRRSKGELVFDIGICLVLISLPAMALYVSVQTLRLKETFMPAYATWYTAMLFAVVPIRNFLPGAPPPGSWVDQAIVLWTLILLIVAMIMFIVAWRRQHAPDEPQSTPPDAPDTSNRGPGAGR